jgi:hypothetical protein
VGMNKSMIIVDDFYDNVDQVREYALNKTFNIKGNYPGYRTEAEDVRQHNYLRIFFEDNIVQKKITYWPREYNTAYQITNKEDKTWIHHDETQWAAVIYLTPNAPIESGTGIYKHKNSNIYRWDGIKKSTSDFNHSDVVKNLDEWEQINFIGNIYNRLVVYDGYLYHRSVLAGFGENKQTGRLFQTFFFNT